MTCIVAWVTETEMVMGGDAASTSGGLVRLHRDSKIFQITIAGRPALIGYCGSARLGQLLRTVAWGTIEPPSFDVFEWVICTIVPFLRDRMKAAGLAKVDNNREELFDGGSFLLATRRRLFEIWGDAQVSESAEPYSAAGSGRSEALGALYAMRQQILNLEPRIAVESALMVSAHFNAYVRPPFTIERVTFEAGQ